MSKPNFIIEGKCPRCKEKNEVYYDEPFIVKLWDLADYDSIDVLVTLKLISQRDFTCVTDISDNYHLTPQCGICNLVWWERFKNKKFIGVVINDIFYQYVKQI